MPINKVDSDATTHVSEDMPGSAKLLKRIRDKRRDIKVFLNRHEPLGTRLTNVNIVCGAVATVLTATPAIGGETLMDVFGGGDASSLSWRIAFAAAALFSLASTIAANLYKSRDMAARLSGARACAVKLEGLETSLDLEQITLKEADTRYAQYISEIPYVREDLGGLLRRQSALDLVQGEILEPKRGQVVDKAISCFGRVEGVTERCHLWLAVESGPFIWPKEKEIYRDQDSGAWRYTIHEEGMTKMFRLSLFVADDRANKRIRAWIDRGDETGNYPQFRRPRGMRRVASVEELRSSSSLEPQS